jgi:uncharacterized protein (DUF1501 family)
MRRDCSCNEFSRSALLRKAVAEAGSGLPGIEPGMPLPAGTGLDRRSFLARSVGLGLAVYGASALAPSVLDHGIAQALAAGPPDTVLVSIFLDGGADSLSLLFPHGDPEYRKLRPKLALPDSGLVFPEDTRLRWHPSAAAFHTLHAEGKLSVLPAVGYTNADQSHFTSRHYWEVGDTDTRLQTGWLGRYLDRVGNADNPLQGVSLDGDLSPALATAKKPVAALNGAGNYSFWSPGVWGQVEDRMLEAVGSLGAARGRDTALASARAVTFQSNRLRQQLAPFDTGNGFNSPVPYPQSDSGFPDQLAGLASMLAAGLPIHCVALGAYGSYDTHSEQADTLAEGIKLTSDSLLAFQRDLEARGLANRVLTLVWSEFGRRAEENGSDGTDHGAAGLGLLMGTRVRGTMIGEFPGLKNGLDDDGNLEATVDFRTIYSSVLEQWLGTDAAGVIPRAGSVGRVPLLR